MEVQLRERILGDGNDVFTIGGIAVVGTTRQIEVCDMRGNVLRRIPVTEIADWVAKNHYRYVPRTMGAYHREAPQTRHAPVLAALPAPA